MVMKSGFLCEHFYNIIIVTITEVLFTLQFDIILMFFRLEDPVESHRNVFSINREIPPIWLPFSLEALYRGL